MLLLLSLILLVPGLHARQEQRNKLILIVLDGFRWDYFQNYQERTGNQLEGFQKFMSAGVRTEYLESVFPAESFPAWQTLQTGVYPEVHGIIGNQFYSQEVHKLSKSSQLAFFNIDDERTTGHSNYWQKDGVEPIWATAVKHDVSFATFLWGRCDVPYGLDKRLSPRYCETFYSWDRTKLLSHNIDRALIQIQQGVDAAIIYEPSLGKASEDFGPFSDQVDDTLRELDLAMKQLENRLDATRMNDTVNVIIVSDHGITSGPNSHDQVNEGEVKLSDYITEETCRWIVGSGSHAGIYPKRKNMVENIVEGLQSVKGIKVYRKSEIPEELHYKHNKNSPPILVLAEPGTIIVPSAENIQRPFFNNGYSSQILSRETKMGFSGYNPKKPDMRGIFIAKGPDFKSTGEVYPKIKLVDVYQIVAHVLVVPPQPNNGTWEDVRNLLEGANKAESTAHSFIQFVLTIFITVSNGIISCLWQ